MILRLCYESDLDFDIAVLDKSLDLENQLANAKAGAGDPIFFYSWKMVFIPVELLPGQKNTYICPGWTIPGGKPG